MHLTTEALQRAAGTLQEISETTPGERGRRASVVALVLRSVECTVESRPESRFLGRRARAEVEGSTTGAERAVLRRLLEQVSEGAASEIADALSDYAAGLEEARRLAEADTVMTLARSLEPARPEHALRAGRVARLLGDRERALTLYRVARELDGGEGSVSRLAAIGEAVVAPEPEYALSVAIRRAIQAGDGEAAAVGLEERGRVRRSRGHRLGAVRDFACAATRYPDAVDRARVAHQIADLFVAADDPAGAREALLFALQTGDRSQRDHARARLHTVARDMDDQLGMRRWRSFQPPALVSLSARRSTAPAGSSAPVMARWRDKVESLIAVPTG